MTPRTATVAAAAALCAALAGGPAGADELSTLRANDMALQQKLDQIDRQSAPAPVPFGTPGGAVPGSFPRSFLVPGTETSVRVGGNLSETLHYSPR